MSSFSAEFTDVACQIFALGLFHSSYLLFYSINKSLLVPVCFNCVYFNAPALDDLRQQRDTLQRRKKPATPEDVRPLRAVNAEIKSSILYMAGRGRLLYEKHQRFNCLVVIFSPHTSLQSGLNST